jgi:hypothetical protein
MAMTDDDPPFRTCSRALFGNQVRLEVCAKIAEDEHEVTYSRKLAEALNLPDNQVRNELRRLEDGGYLRSVPRVHGGREPVYFQRQPSVLWTFAPLLLAEVQARETHGAA